MRLGIDIGSTTAKAVLLDSSDNIVFSTYVRHKTQIQSCIISILQEILEKFGDVSVSICFTGSAGMGVAENNDFKFVQEVIAASEVIEYAHPDIHTLIDIGGEDSKLIFFEKDKTPDIRMNGSCAGGTGAFIEQIVSLLDVSLDEFNTLAEESTHIYPIASRCGVFAKTDVQNLISRKIPIADIAASTFYAIALQVVNSLARGIDITPQIMCIGGPFTFIPALRKAFYSVLSISEDECVFPENGALFPAWGAALYTRFDTVFRLQEVITILKKETKKYHSQRLSPLFTHADEYNKWVANRSVLSVPRVNPAMYNNESVSVFLGIDSGSTTTKVVFVTKNGEVCASFYGTNNGKPIETVIAGIEHCAKCMGTEYITFLRTGVTGYGEDLIRAAFNLDHGIVETIAHATASQEMLPEVSFILDIGGQDMKAIFLKNNAIQHIEINEACSSGCGSFVQNFSHSLSYPIEKFASLATKAQSPCDLGSRCTVFMNSQVKQALREGADVSEISAGLAYSVVKNALFKVLRISNMDVLGEHVMVQGGTFKNMSVFRAMEKLTNTQIHTTDIPELMGAYGTALYVKKQYEQRVDESFSAKYEDLHDALHYTSKHITCRGCTNNCIVTKFVFRNSQVYYSGNKCEKIFTSQGNLAQEKGENLYDYKYSLLFNRNLDAVFSSKKFVRIGIPRILGMYSNFPFWNTLFTQVGFSVTLSDESNYKLFEKGQGTIMSDNICFPAKLAHGHIINLVEKEVDRIFYPMVMYEEDEHEGSQNSFNCPVVSSYAEVLESSISTSKRNNIQIDKPVVSFRNEEVLKKNCWLYIKQFGISRYLFTKAFKAALSEQKNYREQYRLKGFRILERAKIEGKPIVMLAGRPYHADPLIHQRTSQILTELGATVITEEIVNHIEGSDLSEYLHVPQWNYPNRILSAAQWVVKNQDYRIHFVQMNSFGCGPDSFIVDEIKEFFDKAKASYTLIRVDEINSTGSMRLRLRSLVETINLHKDLHINRDVSIPKTPVFTSEDRHKQIIGPFFTEFHSPFIAPAFELMGYNMESLPVSDNRSVELGLQYANNEICYPATLIVGDIIKALQSGKYDVTNTAVVMSQTGGQCRASNYLALIKKALINAGFDSVPVISLATGEGISNNQPGFTLEWRKIIKVLLTGVVFGDILSRMYYATVVREKHAGATKKITQDYLDNAAELVRLNNVDALLELLSQAVQDYNNLALDNCVRPQIGIVGEIYLKYNPYANLFVADWLVNEGIEVRFPDLLDFFVQEFVNTKVNEKNKFVTHGLGKKFFVSFLEKKLTSFTDKMEGIARGFKYYRPKHSIYQKAQHGSYIVDLANQYGEGWLIPAEISLFANEGVNNVVSIQPFGCIANHIIAKGVERKMRNMYPHLNILFLDFDGGSSKVNVFNRLHFMVEHAKKQMIQEQTVIKPSNIIKDYHEN
ncbi:MAG: acyl-CoA dehydratase activase-related protein [Bacteroidales bacterium]